MCSTECLPDAQQRKRLQGMSLVSDGIHGVDPMRQCPSCEIDMPVDSNTSEFACPKCYRRIDTTEYNLGRREAFKEIFIICGRKCRISGCDCFFRLPNAGCKFEKKKETGQ